MWYLIISIVSSTLTLKHTKQSRLICITHCFITSTRTRSAPRPRGRGFRGQLMLLLFHRSRSSIIAWCPIGPSRSWPGWSPEDWSASKQLLCSSVADNHNDNSYWPCRSSPGCKGRVHYILKEDRVLVQEFISEKLLRILWQLSRDITVSAF